MSEQAPPLPKHLYDKIKEAGLAIVGIHWQGGSDEGYVHITSQANDQAEIKKTDAWKEYMEMSWDEREKLDDCHPVKVWQRNVGKIEAELEEWAWNTFHYSGAGDGTDYGDDYFYNVVQDTVEHSEWFMERQDQDPTEMKLTLETEDTSAT